MAGQCNKDDTPVYTWSKANSMLVRPDVSDYISRHSLREHPTLQKLYEATRQHPRHLYLACQDEMQFLANLVKLTKGKKTLDIGTYTGYSAMAIALVLPNDGCVVTMDVDAEYVNVGKPFWKEAGMDHKIDLRVGPAKETLEQLISAGESGTFDFAFIDADKLNYPNYYELCLQLLRPGGIVAIDNVLWNGQVMDPAITDPDTLAIRALNTKIKDDPRVDVSMLLFPDGMTLCYKR